MYCEKCGAKLSPEDVYCPECGSSVEDDSTVRVGRNSGQSHREYVQDPSDDRTQRQYSEKPQEQPYSRHQAVSSGGQQYNRQSGGHNQQASWQHQQQSRQPERRYHPDERFQGGSYQSNEQGSKDKLLYAFLGIITVILVIGIIWGVATLMDLNDEEDTTVETQEASAEEINPDLESETEEAVTVTPTPTAAPTSTPIPTPAVTAAPAATAVPTQAPAVEYVAVKYGLQAPVTDFMFPYSSERLLTQAELDSMVDASVEVMHSRSQLAINEILARYGYSFDPNKSDTAKDIYNRVAGKDWYQQAQQQCGYSDANSLIADMNSVEKDNINLINEWQQQHGCYY